MTKTFTKKGMSLIEVVMATAVLGVVIMLSIEISGLRGDLLSRTRTSYDLGETLMSNVIEAKARNLDSLQIGKCYVRLYTHKFESEKVVDNSSTECGKNDLKPFETQIVWKVKGPKDINHTFVPAATMKLPIYNIALVQIEVVGRTRINASKKIESAGTLIFKR